MIKKQISLVDFAKIDLRVGKVLKVEPIKKSQKLLCLTVDLGNDYGTKTILAGLQGQVKPQELIGQKFLFVANLAPRLMLGAVSYGMILAADDQDLPVLIPVSDSLPAGTIIR